MPAILAALTAGLLLGQNSAAPAPQAVRRVVAVVAVNNVVYAKVGERELRLDIALPAEGDGPYPAILCLHGGGWVSGDRTKMVETLKTLAARGYVAIAPDFRLAPQDPFPAAIEDCKAAVRYLRANARSFRLDPDRVGVVGFSSGAYLACMLGVTVASDGLEGEGGNGLQSSRVQAVVSFFGPTDLETADFSEVVTKTNLIPFLGGTRKEKADLYHRASPIVYADRKDQPPFLFFHGTADKIVPIDHSRRMVDRLSAAGNSAQLITVEGEGHGYHGEALTRSLQQMMDFLDQKLKK